MDCTLTFVHTKGIIIRLLKHLWKGKLRRIIYLIKAYEMLET